MDVVVGAFLSCLARGKPRFFFYDPTCSDDGDEEDYYEATTTATPVIAASSFSAGGYERVPRDRTAGSSASSPSAAAAEDRLASLATKEEEETARRDAEEEEDVEPVPLPSDDTSASSSMDSSDPVVVSPSPPPPPPPVETPATRAGGGDDGRRRRRRRTVLITGASGYVGQHLLRSVAFDRPPLFGDDDDDGDAWSIVACHHSLPTFPSAVASELDRRRRRRRRADDGSAPSFPNVRVERLDVSDPLSIRSVLERHRPDVVVHLAAIADPSLCESSPATAMGVNCPLGLLDATDDGATTLICVSTDQVYGDRVEARRAAPSSLGGGGEGGSPRRETDEAVPMNRLGETKLAFEAAILSSPRRRDSSVVLRIGTVLGPEAPFCPTSRGGTSYLQFVDDRLSVGMTVEARIDEQRSYVSICDVVETIRYFVGNGVKDEGGIYNLSGFVSSRYEVATAVGKEGHRDPGSVKPVERGETGGGFKPWEVPCARDASMDGRKFKTLTDGSIPKITSLSDAVRLGLLTEEAR